MSYGKEENEMRRDKISTTGAEAMGEKIGGRKEKRKKKEIGF